MVPVTLGLGLINVNAVIDTFFASRLIDAEPRADRDPEGVPRLHAAAGDVLGRDRDRAVPDAVALRVARRHGGLPGDGRATACGRSRSCSSRRPSSAPCSPSRSSASSSSAASSFRRRRPVVAARARRVQRGPRLQRRDADAEPRVLQPPVELGADGDRARQPVPQRRCSTSCSTASGRGASRSRRRSATSRARPRCSSSAATPHRPLRRRARSRRPSMKVVAASAAVAAVAWFVWHPLDSALGRSFPAQVVSLGLALAASVGVYLLGCRMLQGARDGRAVVAALSPPPRVSIRFEPLTRDDLPQLLAWLQKPHVAEWWRDLQTMEQVEADASAVDRRARAELPLRDRRRRPPGRDDPAVPRLRLPGVGGDPPRRARASRASIC